MMTWFNSFLEPESEAQSLEQAIAERRRLDELIRCHREFGFDAYVEDLRRHRDELDRHIREHLKR